MEARVGRRNESLWDSNWRPDPTLAPAPRGEQTGEMKCWACGLRKAGGSCFIRREAGERAQQPWRERTRMDADGKKPLSHFDRDQGTQPAARGVPSTPEYY